MRCPIIAQSLSITRLLILLLVLVNTGCQKELSDETPDSYSVIGNYYYKANIGGTSYGQEVTDTNGYVADEGVDGTTDVTFGGGISYTGTTLPSGGTEFGITKGIMHNFTSITQDQFKAFFSPGDYSYAPIDGSTGTFGDGISLYWVEPDGTDMWITGDGTTMQSGSSFKIISAADATDAQGNYYLKVKVQFTCNFYSINTGATKTVTNGEAVVKFTMH
jgi:hypothetical protein